MTLTFGSLFAGIGGLDLGLERAGFKVRWQVEIDEYAQKVLEKHWPDVARFRDVRDCGKENLERVDLICGGFPCQPVSQAGKRQGEHDERWLWPQFYRLVCEIKPAWVLAENVPGLLSINSGRTFAGILRGLAQSGYNAEWGSIRACNFGAFHERERVFIIAHSTKQLDRIMWARPQRQQRVVLARGNNPAKRRQKIENISAFRVKKPGWTSEPRLPRLVNGISGGLDERRRVALGNAVVPQVAQWIGERILEAHNNIGEKEC